MRTSSGGSTGNPQGREMANFGTFSSYLVENWLLELNGTWAALHYDNPEVAGAYASEIFGGSYIRCNVQFEPPDSRATWNANEMYWSGLPAVKISYIALWDAQTNGNYLCSAPLVNVINAVAGSTYRYPAKSFAVSF